MNGLTVDPERPPDPELDKAILGSPGTERALDPPLERRRSQRVRRKEP